LSRFENASFRWVNALTKAWSGLTTREYKQVKGLKKEGLRDNMTNLELVLNMLAEATTTEISKEKQPEGLEQNRLIAKQGGTIAGNTRKEIEEKIGKPVVSTKNSKRLK
jgi:1,6-anhydro-N-acetylmuramate kinase